MLILSNQHITVSQEREFYFLWPARAQVKHPKSSLARKFLPCTFKSNSVLQKTAKMSDKFVQFLLKCSALSNAENNRGFEEIYGCAPTSLKTWQGKLRNRNKINKQTVLL